MLQSASLIVVRLTDTPYMQNIAVFKKIYVYLSTFQYKWHALVKIWEIFFFIEKENSTNTQNFLKQSFSAGIICTELNSRAYLCFFMLYGFRPSKPEPSDFRGARKYWKHYSISCRAVAFLIH